MKTMNHRRQKKTKSFKKASENKKSKKNRTFKKGGTPKINFAYTYCIIDFETLQKLPLLNSFLLEKTRVCDCISIGTPLTNCSPNSSFSFLQNSSQKCILVMKYNDLASVTQDPSLFNNQELLNRILGHAKTIQKENIIGIYNVCLHLTNKVGYGSVLFNVVLTAISFYPDLTTDITLWLGIRLENVQFSKVAYLYAIKGFHNPSVTSQDISGQQLPFEFVQLTKNLYSYITNEDEVLIDYAKIMDLYYQTKQSKQLTDLSKPYTCTFTFTFDKSAILSLRLFPYMGDKGITNILTENFQREYAGVFHIFNARIENNSSVIYKLSLETLSENRGIKYTKGEEESVLYAEGDRTFHTHPIAAYLKYQTLLGTPSGSDFVAFYSRFQTHKNSQFHVVITIEGIYIISLSEFTLTTNKDLTPNMTSEYVTQMSNHYEYPFTERPFDWKAEGDFDESVIPQAIEKYLKWFSIQNQKYQNLFELQFFPWKKLQKDTQIQVHYPNLNGYCYCEYDT
jgi:hypothetical protein